MTKFLIRTAMIIIAIASDIAWPQIRFAAPNFIFLLVVLYAFREETKMYLGFAIFGGLLFDVYTRNAFGSYIIGFLLIGLVIRFATATLFRSEPRSVPYMAAAIIASNVLLIAWLYLYNALAQRWETGLQNISPLYITHSAWLVILYNLLFAIPLYFAIESIEALILRYSRPRNAIR